LSCSVIHSRLRGQHRALLFTLHGRGMFSLPVHRRDLDARWHTCRHSHSQWFSLDIPCVFPRITPVSPSMHSLYSPRKNPPLKSRYRPLMSLLSIDLLTSISLTDNPSSTSSGHFPSVICWISSASGIFFSDLRYLFLYGSRFVVFHFRLIGSTSLGTTYLRKLSISRIRPMP